LPSAVVGASTVTKDSSSDAKKRLEMVPDMLNTVASGYGTDHLLLKWLAKYRSGERLVAVLGQPDRETKPRAADEKRPAFSAQRLRVWCQSALIKRK